MLGGNKAGVRAAETAKTLENTKTTLKLDSSKLGQNELANPLIRKNTYISLSFGGYFYVHYFHEISYQVGKRKLLKSMLCSFHLKIPKSRLKKDKNINHSSVFHFSEKHFRHTFIGCGPKTFFPSV